MKPAVRSYHHDTRQAPDTLLHEEIGYGITSHTSGNHSPSTVCLLTFSALPTRLNSGVLPGFFRK